MEKRYNSEAMMVAHDLAKDLFEVGAISKDEMNEYDRNCLAQEKKKSNIEKQQSSTSESLNRAVG
jgi:DNA-binding transcriptional regulator YiaG